MDDTLFNVYFDETCRLYQPGWIEGVLVYRRVLVSLARPSKKYESGMLF